MNSALKQTIIAMATAALSMTAACKSNEGPEALEASDRSRASDVEQRSEAGGPTEEKQAADEDSDEGAAEGKCGEGKCGEGKCG